jgi:hypothetical protein
MEWNGMESTRGSIQTKTQIDFEPSAAAAQERGFTTVDNRGRFLSSGTDTSNTRYIMLYIFGGEGSLYIYKRSLIFSTTNTTQEKKLIDPLLAKNTHTQIPSYIYTVS